MVRISEDDGMLPRFKELILSTCGFSLELGRERSLLDGLGKRMAARGVDGTRAYHDLLTRERCELDLLVESLTVNETYFLREPEHLNLAADKLLPDLLAARRGKPVRILSAGCSTGEEPYSIALMLRERYGAESERLFAITGVDIDSCAIAGARRGVYGKGSFRGMLPATLERHFEAAGPGEFRVRDSVRKLVAFEVANLLGPLGAQGAPGPDIIFYRNVSIYFPREVQRKIFTGLAGALSDGGYLMVGAAETLQHNIGVLSLVQREALFFYQKTPARRREERPVAGLAAPISGPRLRPSAAPRPNALPEKPAPAPPVKPPCAAPQKPGTLLDAALELARAGLSEQALERLAPLSERDPLFAKALTLKGSLLLSVERFQEAEAACDRVIQADPLSLEAHLMLGMIAWHQGLDEAGSRRFREAIYLDGSCWPAHFYSAEMLFAKGDRRRARTGYQAALRILEQGAPRGAGEACFPLFLNEEQFLVICRHKVALLKENG